MQARHLYVPVDSHDLFYGHAGPSEAPTLLLHGFASSSIEFRYMLAEPPDLPGFGFNRQIVTQSRT